MLALGKGGVCGGAGRAAIRRHGPVGEEKGPPRGAAGPFRLCCGRCGQASVVPAVRPACYSSVLIQENMLRILAPVLSME